MTQEFYVYIHCTPDGDVFYVGKGAKRRAYEFRGRSKWHRHVTEKHGKNNIAVQIIARTTDEMQALSWEVCLIEHLSCTDKLVNLTLGGEGVSGYVHSQEVIEAQQIRMSMMRDRLSDMAVRRFEVDGARAAASVRQRKLSTPENRLNLSNKLSAVYSTDDGRKIQSERSRGYWKDGSSRLKQSLLTREFLADDDRKADWVESIKKGWTDEKRKAQSERMKLRFSNPDERAKISAARNKVKT
jgi:hypothetical protein